MEWDELPEGWGVERLNAIATVRAGSSAPQGQEYFVGGEYPFVRAQDVGRYGRTKCLTETADKVNDKALEEKRMVLAKKGAILLPKSGASILTNNRAMLGIDAYVVSHLAIVEAEEVVVSKDFLYYWLCKYDVTSHTRNKAYPSLSLSDIKSFEIPLPLLDEQRRIVARIEELTERIDAARRLRAEAVEEAAAILSSALAEVFGEDMDFDWIAEPLENILLLCHSGTWGDGEAPPGEGFPVLRSTNIQNWRLDLDADTAYRQITERDIEKYKLDTGDIIVTRSSGSARLIGEVAFFEQPDDGQPYLFSNFTQRLRPDPDTVEPKFLFWYLQSPPARLVIQKMHATTSGLRNLNMSDYRAQPVPIPPLPEQRRIVEYLDAVQAKVEAIRRYQEETQQEIEAMTGAVLERAFRGEL